MTKVVVGNGRRAPETERETTDTSEGAGEAARLALIARGGCRMGWRHRSSTSSLVVRVGT